MNDNHARMREQVLVYCLPGPLAAGNKTSLRTEAKIRAFTPGCGTAEPLCATTSRKRPPPISDHSQITTVRPSRKIPPLVSERDLFFGC